MSLNTLKEDISLRCLASAITDKNTYEEDFQFMPDFYVLIEAHGEAYSWLCAEVRPQPLLLRKKKHTEECFGPE